MIQTSNAHHSFSTIQFTTMPGPLPERHARGRVADTSESAETYFEMGHGSHNACGRKHPSPSPWWLALSAGKGGIPVLPAFPGVGTLRSPGAVIPIR